MRYNVPKSCATRSCCACVDLITCVAERYLTLRTGSERHGRKNPLSYSYFRSCRRSLVCVRLSNKGKVGVQRGRETAGVPSFLPTAVGTASSPRRAPRRSRRSGGASLAEVQRKLSAPSGRTRLRSSSPPAFRCRKKLPPVKGEPASGSSRAPLSRCRKRCRPEWANRLSGSCTP